jgi:hypothetical protein
MTRVQKNHVKKIKRVQLRHLLQACVLCIGLSGCEQIRTGLADMLSPPSDAQMAARIGDLANGGKLREAIDAGEKFLNSNPSENNRVNAKLADLYLENGDSVKALLHLEKSHGDVIESPGAATGQLSIDAVAINPPDTPTAPAASAKAGPNGAEAIAGNAKASTKP